MHVQQMIASHPRRAKAEGNDALIRCVEACYDCAQACVACADACLGEDKIKMLAQCIRLNLDCADVCAATGAILSRRTGTNADVACRMLNACGLACSECADECDMHAKAHEHCRICAEACRRCEDACEAARQTMERMQ
jgi:hypothetical protein